MHEHVKVPGVVASWTSSYSGRVQSIVQEAVTRGTFVGSIGRAADELGVVFLAHGAAVCARKAGGGLDAGSGIWPWLCPKEFSSLILTEVGAASTALRAHRPVQRHLSGPSVSRAATTCTGARPRALVHPAGGGAVRMSLRPAGGSRPNRCTLATPPAAPGTACRGASR
eukprot:scaffold115_cov304-Prasinococcus_capsulatus_cf.AAC.53